MKELKDYDREGSLPWLQKHAVYLGDNSMTDVTSQTPLAYDKSMLAQGLQDRGTTVLFGDGHVSYLPYPKLQALGIIKADQQARRIESMSFLKQLGLMCHLLRNDAGHFPKRMSELKNYDPDESLIWLQKHALYLGNDAMTKTTAQTPLAFDKSMLAQSVGNGGTTVLYGDGHVSYRSYAQLLAIGIVKNATLHLKTTVLTAPKDKDLLQAFLAHEKLPEASNYFSKAQAERFVKMLISKENGQARHSMHCKIKDGHSASVIVETQGSNKRVQNQASSPTKAQQEVKLDLHSGKILDNKLCRMDLSLELSWQENDTRRIHKLSTTFAAESGRAIIQADKDSAYYVLFEPEIRWAKETRTNN